MFQENNMEYRIGQSRDIHRLEKNHRPLIIAGVHLDYEKGPVSHSDGDVVYHALAEAILGALALGDLGTFFPDNDDRYLNLNSSLILKEVIIKMENAGYEINNIDVNIILQKPKLHDFIDTMRQNIAYLVKTNIENVSIKAQTNEGLDEVGKNNAVESTAICLLRKK